MAPPNPRRRNRPDRARAREARRAELLDAAVAVIHREGPEASMESIAKEAGITKPILYRHFDNRAGLVRALAEQFGERLTEVLDERLDVSLMAQPPRPRAVLHDTIETYIAFIEADPGMYAFLTQRGPSAAKPIGVADRVATAVARALGEGLRLTDNDVGAAEPWSYGIVGLVHLAGEWWVNHPKIPRAELVAYLTDLLWGGLGSALGELEGDS